MYKSVEQALEHVFKIAAVRIEPANGTAIVCGWGASGGASKGTAGMTQHDWHAHAVMVISRCQKILEECEYAVLSASFGYDLSGIVDLIKLYMDTNKNINPLLCNDILANLFIASPKQTAIMDKYDLSNGKMYRHREKIKDFIDKLYNDAICKLEPEFIRLEIVVKEVACQ